MNRKVLGIIAAMAVILIVVFSVRALNGEDKVKDVTVKAPTVPKVEDVVATEGMKELQQLKAEAGKENPLTEQEMIKISQDQVRNFYNLGMVNSQEELKAVVKKFYYYYDEGLENAKNYYDPGVSKNLKVQYEQESVTKNGADTFTYVAITTPSADNIKTGAVDTFKQNITIDFKKGTDGTYKAIYLKADLIN